MGKLYKMRSSALKFNKDLTAREVNRAGTFAEHLFSVITKQRGFLHEHSQSLIAVTDFSAIFTFGEAGKKGSPIVTVMPQQRSTREWILKQKVLKQPLIHC